MSFRCSRLRLPVLLTLSLASALSSCREAPSSVEPTPASTPPSPYRLTAEDVAMVVEVEQALVAGRTAVEQGHRALGEALAATGRVPLSDGSRPVVATRESLVAERAYDLERYERARLRIEELRRIERGRGERRSQSAFRRANLVTLRASRERSSDEAERARLDEVIAEVEQGIEAASEQERAFASFDDERRLVAPHQELLYGKSFQLPTP